VGFATTDGRGTTCVDAKFKTKDGVADAFRVETVPVFVNDGDNFGFDGRADSVANN
jgi:hypothetical protein